MINLQQPNIPEPIKAIEIERAIYMVQILFETNLDWLSNSYGRAYRFISKGEKNVSFPEVYKGGEKHSYYRVTPDNDKKGTCFFVVGKEQVKDYEINQTNYLTYRVGVIFWVNLKKINKSLIENEDFTQNLIRDVRHLLTRRAGGLGFNIEVLNVERELREIYREFDVKEEEEYLRKPYSGFRFNVNITIRENCGEFTFNPIAAVAQNLSPAEKLAVLKSIDFSIQENKNALTEEQRLQLGLI